MNEQSHEILNFLRANPEVYFNRKEIAKKAVHRSVYEENPHWVTAPLAGLVNDGMVEQNDEGHYRIKQEQDSKSSPT